MTTITKLKLLPRTAMKAKAATRLVGQVIAGDGIAVEKTGGVFTFSVDPDYFPSFGHALPFQAGSVLFADDVRSVSALAPATSGNALLSGTSPAWGKVGLTTHVAGTLPGANGGTGWANYAVGDILYADGAASLAKLSAGTAGLALLANGAGQAPSYQGFLQSGTGAVTRTWQARLRDTYSVKDFGAVGNGSTDDTAAITAAIAAVPSGSTLYFPEGAYSIRSAGSEIFLIDKRICLKGAGHGTEFVVHSSVGTSTDCFHVKCQSASELRGVYFEDFACVQQGTAGDHIRTWFVLDSEEVDTSVSDVEISNILTDDANLLFVHIKGGTAGSAFDITIKDSVNYGGGIYLDSAGDSIRVDNCVLAGARPGVQGYQAGGAGNLVISRNNIVTIDGSIVLTGGINPLITANVIEQKSGTTNSSTYNAMVDIRGTQSLIESCRIIGNSIQSLAGSNNPDCIRVDNADSTVIDNNRLYIASTNKHVVVTANAVATTITAENSYLASSSSGGDLRLTNASSSTAVTSKYTATPTTFGVLYGAGGTGTNTTGANTTTTRKFLRQVGDGTNSAAPAFDTLALGDLPAITPGILANISVGSAPPVSLGIATVMANVFGNANGMVLNTQGGNWTASTEINLGASGTLGSVTFGNATSGTVKIQPVTGALGTVTLSLPAATDTLVGKATTDTLTNKTFDTAGTGNSFSINGVAVTANTGTGAVARATSPTFVTPTLGAASATSLNVSGTTASTSVTTGALIVGGGGGFGNAVHANGVFTHCIAGAIAQGFQISETVNGRGRALYVTNTSDDAMGFYGLTGSHNIASLDASGAWINASDRRWKDKVEDLRYGVDTLMSLRARQFIMLSTGQPAIGFIAQEVMPHIPELVSGIQHPEDGETYFNLNYGGLSAVTVSALQDHECRLHEYERRIAELEKRIAELLA